MGISSAMIQLLDLARNEKFSMANWFIGPADWKFFIPAKIIIVNIN